MWMENYVRAFSCMSIIMLHNLIPKIFSFSSSKLHLQGKVPPELRAFLWVSTLGRINLMINRANPFLLIISLIVELLHGGATIKAT